jgi:predicted transcriptional regulator
MKGLTGSEIVILLALKKKQMTFEEIDTLLKDPTTEQHKTTQHWVSLLEDKRLIVREPSAPIFYITKKGEEKAQEFIRVIEPHFPVAIALL